MKYLALLFIFAALLLAACETRVSAVPTPTRAIPTPVANPDDLMKQDLFEGKVAFGFETSLFAPCGVSEQWWVIPADAELSQELQRAYDQTAPKEYAGVYARLRGKITARGTFGHLGAYQREFTVSEIVDLRAPQAGDCVQ
jgi:hypothetical protein